MEETRRQGGAGPPTPSPPWVWAALVALALVVVTAGAIVGMVATEEEGESAAGEPPAAIATGAQTEATPPAETGIPPTVSVPPLTEQPPAETGFPGETGAATETVPTDTSDRAATTGTWPAGQSGYTVVLASVPEGQGRAPADAAAARASSAGLPSVGVLRSSDFSSLRPGYWVAYAGVYSTLQEARGALPQAQAAGFASAYTRRVSP